MNELLIKINKRLSFIIEIDKNIIECDSDYRNHLLNLKSIFLKDITILEKEYKKLFENFYLNDYYIPPYYFSNIEEIKEIQMNKKIIIDFDIEIDCYYNYKQNIDDYYLKINDISFTKNGFCICFKYEIDLPNENIKELIYASKKLKKINAFDKIKKIKDILNFLDHDQILLKHFSNDVVDIINYYPLHGSICNQCIKNGKSCLIHNIKCFYNFIKNFPDNSTIEEFINYYLESINKFIYKSGTEFFEFLINNKNIPNQKKIMYFETITNYYSVTQNFTAKGKIEFFRKFVPEDFNLEFENNKVNIKSFIDQISLKGK